MTDNGAPAPRDTLRIRILNDTFRTTLQGGRVVMTSGIAALPMEVQALLVRAVVEFNSWTEDNDPWGEHDFGVVEALGHRAFWKIDVYSKDMQFGSPDPGDANVSTRVLTLLLPEEW